MCPLNFVQCFSFSIFPFFIFFFSLFLYRIPTFFSSYCVLFSDFSHSLFAIHPFLFACFSPQLNCILSCGLVWFFFQLCIRDLSVTLLLGAQIAQLQFYYCCIYIFSSAFVAYCKTLAKIKCEKSTMKQTCAHSHSHVKTLIHEAQGSESTISMLKKKK